MIVYVVRHAWAEERDAERWPDDELRPLTTGGKRRFRRQVNKLLRRGFRPARVATSPLVRAAQTAEIVTRQLGLTSADVRPELSPGSELAGLIMWTLEQGASDVAWVGHAPDVEELTASLIGTGQARLRFGKGAVAAIEFAGPCRAGAGRLRWLVSARLLDV